MVGIIPKAFRALHWVLKIGNLKKSLDFFENVLALRVLRHEEFATGCEATCNGPYGGAWSKTMIGFVPEDKGFALELTYNYGIDSYEFGNDLQYITMQNPAALVRAPALGYAVEGNVIQGPDNYKYKIIPPIAGRAESFAVVGLRVANLTNAKSFWTGVLGLNEYPTSLFPGLEHQDPNCLVGFHEDQTMLQLIEVSDGQPVNHALSSGRIAFACDSVQPIFKTVTESGDKVQVPPLTLPTPGKADVVVTILQDRDGYEICFVEDEAFYQLAEPKYDVIDYSLRASRGGDGAPPPTVIDSDSAVKDGSRVVSVDSVDDINQYMVHSDQRPVVLYFGAGWCKNCKRLAPTVEELAVQYSIQAAVLKIDISADEDLAMEYGVTSVPRFMVYSHGKKVKDYQGSSEAELKEVFAAHLK